MNGKDLPKQQFLEGTTIFSSGDPANEAYLVEKGKILIQKGGKRIATMEEGDIFGEMSLIKNWKHSSTAIAAEKSTLIVISKNIFEKKLENTDPLIKGLIHMLIKRLYLYHQDDDNAESTEA